MFNWKFRLFLSSLLIAFVSLVSPQTFSQSNNIHIEKAEYGSNKNDPELLKYKCEGDKVKDNIASCSFDDFTVKIGELCNESQSCAVPITNEIFGYDPCSGICKVAKIQWRCGSGKKLSPKWIKENDVLKISCVSK